MHDSIYIPCNRTPSQKWLTRALLYWDSVGVLAAGDLDQKQSPQNEHIREFIKAGLVNRIPTENNIAEIPDLAVHFVKYVDSLDQQLAIRQAALVQGDRLPMHERILGKTGKMLVERRLAIRPQDPAIPGYYVEKRTALQFMFYLAFVLGKTGDKKLVPIADRFNLLKNDLSDALSGPKKPDTLKFHFLKNVFPVPQGPLKVDQILRFRQQHGKQLLRFRRQIEKDLMILSMLKEPDSLKSFSEEVIESSKDEKEEIIEIMKKSDFGTISNDKIIAVRAPINGEQTPGLISAMRDAVPNQGISTDNSPMAYVVFPLDDWKTPSPARAVNKPARSVSGDLGKKRLTTLTKDSDYIISSLYSSLKTRANPFSEAPGQDIISDEIEVSKPIERFIEKLQNINQSIRELDVRPERGTGDDNGTTSKSKPNSLSKLKMILEPMISEMITDTVAHQVDSLLQELMGQYLNDRQKGMLILSGKAQVEVKVMTKRGLNKRFLGRGGYLGFGSHREALMHLSSLDCSAMQTGDRDTIYSGTFSLDLKDRSVGKSISFLEQAEYIQIGFSPIPPKSRVLGGTAVVTINNSIRYEYKIPPQMMASNFILIADPQKSRSISLWTTQGTDEDSEDQFVK